ncbi:MAG: hypothetical protein WBB76_09000 [Gaiellaceae bacterium]
MGSAAAGPLEPERSLQDRFERTRLGRLLISAFLLVTLVTILTANLPPSRLQDLLLSADHPYLYGLGLDQDWSVFAPEPRRETIHITAQVTFADGSQTTWHVPTRNPVVGEYTDYRWLKWTEFIVSPVQQQLWQPIARYVARQLATPTRRPVRVSLHDRWYDLLPPGQIPDQPFVRERTIFTIPITESMLHGGS